MAVSAGEGVAEGGAGAGDSAGEEVSIMIFVVGTVWCGACTSYATRIAEISDDIEAAGHTPRREPPSLPVARSRRADRSKERGGDVVSVNVVHTLHAEVG